MARIAAASPQTREPVPRRMELNIKVPREFIELRAYEKFEDRGCQHGHDVADWLAAERELDEVFRSVRWYLIAGGRSPCLTLNAEVTDHSTHALLMIRRYLLQRPGSIGRAAGRSTDLNVEFPEIECQSESSGARKNSIMSRTEPSHPKRDSGPDPSSVRSPVSYLSPDQFAELRGQLVALLLDGPEKGTIIASAVLDPNDPNVARKSIRAQVSDSKYQGRRYQLREILESRPGA